MGWTGTDQSTSQQVLHQGVVNPAVVGLRPNTIDDYGRGYDLARWTPAWGIVYLDGITSSQEVLDATRQDS